jgi:hypothetical protein
LLESPDLELLLSQTPLLERLNVDRCHILTDTAFELIGLKCPYLHELHLSSLSLITEAPLTSLHCVTDSRLEVLDLSDCDNIKYEVASVPSNLKSLRSIDLSSSLHVNDAVIAALAAGMTVKHWLFMEINLILIRFVFFRFTFTSKHSTF